MKNKILIILTTIVFMISCNNAFTQFSKFQLGVNFGVNVNDINYGTDYLTQLLPIDDYNGFGTQGTPALGHTFGINGSFRLGKRFLILSNLNFSTMNYNIQGHVEDMRATVIRPPLPEVPTNLEGKVKYSFLDIQTGLAYSFNDNIQKGFFALVTLNDLIHMRTRIDLEGVDELGNEYSFGQQDVQIQFTEYNNLILIGGGLGYHFVLSEKLTLSPMFTYKHALNDLTMDDDKDVQPTVIDLRANLKWWF
jgi:hypothetical protein